MPQASTAIVQMVTKSAESRNPKDHEAMRSVEQKLRRCQTGETPRVLDLFSGCGGLSLGFLSAGYHIVGAVEEDRTAAATFEVNLAPDEESPGPFSAQPMDIRGVDPRDFLTRLSRGAPDQAVDVIVGGPPCQAFSRVGRAKLRAVADHPEAWRLDDRASLHDHYLRFVAVARPLVILMENVPEILDHGGENIPEEMARQLQALDYTVRYTLLNAAHYGVPQIRERLFLLAVHTAVGARAAFPDPTHHIELPAGYRDKRAWFAGLANRPDGGSGFATRPIDSTPDLHPAVTTREAFANLPRITEHLEGDLESGRRQQERDRSYRPGRPSRYSALMRAWPGMEESNTVTAHVIRNLPRDFPIFARMRPGDQYPEALEIAEDLLEERLERARSNGIDPATASMTRAELRRATVPPYDPDKFPNKWQKLDPESPSHTVTAHLGRDTYSHIHFADEEARTISVREAARLQSFPDSFKFEGGMNAAFKQIGNAVPPLLARAIADEILGVLQSQSSQ